MIHETKWLRVSVAAGLLLVFFTLLPAWGGEGIKERMKARVPAIIALKNRGIIGEGYDGFLHFVGASREGKDIVNAENRDRRTVYEAVAARQSTTVQVVGRRRALQLVKIASPGHYLQKPDGSWYRK